MRIVLTPGALPRLEAPADFRHFSVAIDAGLAGRLRAALAPVADLDGDGHAWVRPDAIRAMAPGAGEPDWEAGFAAMTGFAARQGWLDPQGRIRAHVEEIDSPPAVADEAFRHAMRRFASGVCVVSTGAGEARRGMTVSAFSSVSAAPPMILVCLNRSASSHEALVAAERFGVSILAAGQEEVALRFAGQRGLSGAARFDAGWSAHPAGVPVLAGALQGLVCATEARHGAGSHTILVGRVIDALPGPALPALINFEGAMAPGARAA